MPQAINWMGKLKRGDEVLYVHKLEAKAERSGTRREFSYAVDAAGQPKKFACFQIAGDTRAGNVTLTRKVVELKRSRRGVQSDAQVVTKTTFYLSANVRAGILSVLPTAD